MTLHIRQAALLMTIQDAGRFGYQRFGMPESGPMDGWAFYAANQLVSNAPGAACVEVGFSSAEFYLESRCLIAVCGAGYRLFVNQRQFPLWMAILVKSGDRIWMEKIPGGNWAYLAVGGGIQSAVWMGSRSAYPAAGLGHRLVAGDCLPIPAPSPEAAMMAGRSLSKQLRPAYSSQPLIRVIPGPHREGFDRESWEAILKEPYSISSQSDRMGYRLTGPLLAHQEGPDLVSQGMVLGEIQVPGDGQPIVMMPDHPTTGGYTCIATVARVDLPLLAQVEPGRGALRFTPINLVEAQSDWDQFVGMLGSMGNFQEEPWIGI